jgi:glycosyltransferase
MRAGNRKKTFVTLFPAAENVHLTKDVGMIPYIMGRDYGYEASLVCFTNGEYPTYKYLRPFLNLTLLGRNRKYIITRPSFRMIRYLYRNAKKIDVLNLYHLTYETILYGIIYRLFHKKGRVYLKLDMDSDAFMRRKRKYSISRLFLFDFLLGKMTNLVSYEVSKAERVLQTELPALRKKIIHIPNGIDDGCEFVKNIPRIPFARKEDLIISVGRIGSYQKNNQMLLEALLRVDLKLWKVVFIGPIAESFQQYISDFFEKNSAYKESIFFTGSIENRTALYDWYNRAKVFCLTSRSESFGIVFPEALFYGDFIITTDVYSSKEIVPSDEVGWIVDSDTDLSNRIQQIIDGKIDIGSTYEDRITHSLTFRWTHILSHLHERIELLDL